MFPGSPSDFKFFTLACWFTKDVLFRESVNLSTCGA